MIPIYFCSPEKVGASRLWRDNMPLHLLKKDEKKLAGVSHHGKWISYLVKKFQRKVTSIRKNFKTLFKTK
jgi:hypothetical protein